jgi:quinol-cytochrome oxidoreductase complex cytochrome b subunit
MGSPTLRTIALAVGVVFVVGFFGMTLVVIARDGITVLVVFALIIVALLAMALWGAANNPPDEG